MKRLSPLTAFVLAAFGWIVVLTALWSQVSAWTSAPVGWMSQVALEQGAPMWVRQVHLRPGAMEVDTAVAVPVATAGGRLGEITVEANPARYAYGLPILLALLLAARGSGRLVRALAGFVLLLPAQAFSLTMYTLMQVALAAGLNVRVLRIEPWQLEAIVFGYQFGALVVPALTPILLWLWLDRRFVAGTLLKGWRAPASAASEPAPRA